MAAVRSFITRPGRAAGRLLAKAVDRWRLDLGVHMSKRSKSKRVSPVVRYLFVLGLGLGLGLGLICIWLGSFQWAGGGVKYSNVGLDFDPRWRDGNLSWFDMRGMMVVMNSSRVRVTASTVRLPRRVKKAAHKRGSRTRTFGCLRDGCRGLAIEDLLDRGWVMKFKSSFKNGTNPKEFKDINYHVTFLLTDTTTLTQMEAQRSDLFRKIYDDYAGSSYVTAFDGADYISGNKGKQLRVKARFAARKGCRYNDLGIQPAQYRLYVKEECEALLEIGGKQRDLTWLLKPEYGSQGQGITFHTEVDEIAAKRSEFFPCRDQLSIPATKRALVQQYIEAPLLLKGTKFDARVYMLIASGDPWMVFYHEGYLRRSLWRYSPLSKDRKVYLTNTHYQSMKKGFKLSEHIWSFDTLQVYLKEKSKTSAHYIEASFNPYIKSVVNYVFHSAVRKLKPRVGSFHIIGLDFMVDADFGIHFIEANGYPGYTWSINFDSRGLVEEQFDLVQELHEAPWAFRLMRPGDRYGTWHLVHSGIASRAAGRRFNPCESFRSNLASFAPMKRVSKILAGITGAKGSTKAFDDPSRFRQGVTGWRYIGGEKGETFEVRKRYVHGTCDYASLPIEPPTFLLYNETDCSKLFNSGRQGAWLVKHVQGEGNGDGLVYFASTADVRKQFYPCKPMAANWVAQQLIRSPLRLDVERVANPWIGRGDAVATNERERLDVFGEDPQVRFDLRAYMLVASVDPLTVWYHDGFLRSVRPALFRGYYGLKVGEHLMSFDELQFYLAASQSTGAHYLSSYLRPYLMKVMEYIVHASKAYIPRRNASYHTHHMFAVNFALTTDMQVLLTGISGNESHQAFFPNEAATVNGDVAEEIRRMNQSRRELVVEMAASPAGFLRMKRGDSYSGFHLVFSEMEEKREGGGYDGCGLFKGVKQFISAESLAKTAALQNFMDKRHASNVREMNKYINKRWDFCKYKQTRELQASCVRNTVAQRYKIFAQKERIPHAPGWIDGKIRELQDRHRPGQVPRWKLEGDN